MQSIALAMAQEFGFTREIEDPVQTPSPIWLVAVEKMFSGAAQGMLSAAIVLPIASVVHAPGVEAHLTLHWWLIVTLVPLACIAMGGLGLVLGTSFEPRNIGLMFGFIILPITFLGGTYYSWTKLSPGTVGGWHWLQTIVLINPLIYVNEGMRAAFTNAPHMHLYVIYPVVVGFGAVFLAIGLRNFRRAVIHTEDLTKVYQGTDFAAVDKLNLDVRTGEIFGLLGPNSAGKTTTAGMLTTRVVPTSGRALLGGIDVAAHPALAKQLSGIVSQQNTLDRQLTVWENLYFHGRLFGMGAKVSRQTADQLLEQFQLSRWAKASVYALSGGMAQRLMVARAIFHRPSVLFLDEPTAGLDPQSRLALWDLLGELHDEGQTILLTTHYMEEADRLCQRVAIMDHGRILALDTPAALKQGIGADTIVTVRTTGDPGRLAELLAKDVEGVTRTRVADDKIELHMQGADRLVPRIVLAAEREGYDLLDVSIAEPTLETVFITLTGRELREE